MTTVKRLIVVAMEWACGKFDHVYRWLPWPLTRLACPRGLGLWSSELDERWHTSVWTGQADLKVDPDPQEPSP